MAHHAPRMMVISAPLSDFLALWSSHRQVKNIVPVGTIPPILITNVCGFLWHVVSPPRTSTTCAHVHVAGAGAEGDTARAELHAKHEAWRFGELEVTMEEEPAAVMGKDSSSLLREYEDVRPRAPCTHAVSNPRDG